MFENENLIECLKTDGTFLLYSSKEWDTKEARRIRIRKWIGTRKEARNTAEREETI